MAGESDNWLARGREIGARAQARAAARGAGRLRGELPGVDVTAGSDAIVLSGRGLWRRWTNDARLRAIGSLIR